MIATWWLEKMKRFKKIEKRDMVAWAVILVFFGMFWIIFANYLHINYPNAFIVFTLIISVVLISVVKRIYQKTLRKNRKE